jgi:hypothetical protein
MPGPHQANSTSASVRSAVGPPKVVCIRCVRSDRFAASGGWAGRSTDRVLRRVGQGGQHVGDRGLPQPIDRVHNLPLAGAKPVALVLFGQVLPRPDGPKRNRWNLARDCHDSIGSRDSKGAICFPAFDGPLAPARCCTDSKRGCDNIRRTPNPHQNYLFSQMLSRYELGSQIRGGIVPRYDCCKIARASSFRSAIDHALPATSDRPGPIASGRVDLPIPINVRPGWRGSWISPNFRTIRSNISRDS